MCNSRNCRHKKKAVPTPKFFIHYVNGYSEEFVAGGQTPEEAITKLQEEVGDMPISGVKVYEVARAGVATVSVAWEESK